MGFWNPLRNLFLCGLLGLFAGQLGYQLFALPVWVLCITVPAACIAGGIGFWQWKKPALLPRLCFLLLLLISGIGGYRLLLGFVGGGFSGVVLICSTETVCFLFTHRSRDSFYGPLGICTILSSLLMAVALPGMGTMLVAAWAMLLTLDGFRVMGLYQSHHMGKTGHLFRKDPALFRSSLKLFALGLLILVLGAIVLYFLFFSVFALTKLFWASIAEPLHEIAGEVEMYLDALRSRFLSHFHNIGPEGGSHVSEIKSHYHFDLPESSYAIAWLPLAGLLALLSTIGLTTAKVLKNRPPRPETDYVDTIEYLERPRLSIKNWFKNKKYQKITDFSDNNLKIRFIFQQFLRDKSVTEPNALSKTPTELAGNGDPAEVHLAQIYNRVRYANVTATDSDIALAAEYLNRRTGRKRKPE